MVGDGDMKPGVEPELGFAVHIEGVCATARDFMLLQDDHALPKLGERGRARKSTLPRADDQHVDFRRRMLGRLPSLCWRAGVF